MKKKDSNSSWLVWSTIFLAITILGFLSFSIYKESSKKKQVERDIDILKRQAEKIRQENMNLEERIAYLGSQDYQEIQARDELGLQDPGENVVVITQTSAPLIQKTEDPIVENTIKEEYDSEKYSNFLKWWDYFFKK